MRGLRFIALFGGDVQANQSFACAGDSRNKYDYLALFLARFLYDFFDAS